MSCKVYDVYVHLAQNQLSMLKDHKKVKGLASLSSKFSTIKFKKQTAQQVGFFYIWVHEKMGLQKPVAMESRLVIQVLETMNESIPINLKWTNIRTILANHGLWWNSKEKVEAFCCHPSNRGGMMLSPHDVHAKGSAIISLGADRSENTGFSCTRDGHRPSPSSSMAQSTTARW